MLGFSKPSSSHKSKLETIDIIQKSEIPVGKGIASSTADLVSLIGALNIYFNLDLTENDIAKICTQVEPTDNIMFSNTTLFNHYNGDVYRESNSSVFGKVLLIEFKNTVDSVEFGYETEFKKSEESFNKIIDIFFNGLKNQDLSEIAQATTKSAFLNQKALFNPYLKEVYKLTMKNSGLGVCIGHSGSVIGIIYNNQFKSQSFLNDFIQKFSGTFKSVNNYNFIKSGIRIIIEETL